MSTTRKILGQSAPSAATTTTLYTVPAATSTVVSSLVVANRGSTTASFMVAVRPAGAPIADQHYIYHTILLPGRDTFAASLGLTLSATDVVSVQASTALVSFSLFGEETS